MADQLPTGLSLGVTLGYSATRPDTPTVYQGMLSADAPPHINCRLTVSGVRIQGKPEHFRELAEVLVGLADAAEADPELLARLGAAFHDYEQEREALARVNAGAAADVGPRVVRIPGGVLVTGVPEARNSG